MLTQPKKKDLCFILLHGSCPIANFIQSQNHSSLPRPHPMIIKKKKVTIFAWAGNRIHRSPNGIFQEKNRKEHRWLNDYQKKKKKGCDICMCRKETENSSGRNGIFQKKKRKIMIQNPGFALIDCSCIGIKELKRGNFKSLIIMAACGGIWWKSKKKGRGWRMRRGERVNSWRRVGGIWWKSKKKGRRWRGGGERANYLLEISY